MPTRKSTPPVLIPFARERSAHITVTCMLSGKPARFIVDTGAGGTCIDSGALEAFGLAVKKHSTTLGGGVGSTAMQLSAVRKHDLHLAGLNLSRCALYALDLSHVNAGLQAEEVAPVVGVLGADILHARQAVIDYGRQCMVLSATTRPDTAQ